MASKLTKLIHKVFNKCKWIEKHPKHLEYHKGRQILFTRMYCKGCDTSKFVRDDETNKGMA